MAGKRKRSTTGRQPRHKKQKPAETAILDHVTAQIPATSEETDLGSRISSQLELLSAASTSSNNFEVVASIAQADQTLAEAVLYLKCGSKLKNLADGIQTLSMAITSAKQAHPTLLRQTLIDLQNQHSPAVLISHPKLCIDSTTEYLKLIKPWADSEGLQQEWCYALASATTGSANGSAVSAGTTTISTTVSLIGSHLGQNEQTAVISTITNFFTQHSTDTTPQIISNLYEELAVVSKTMTTLLSKGEDCLRSTVGNTVLEEYQIGCYQFHGRYARLAKTDLTQRFRSLQQMVHSSPKLADEATFTQFAQDLEHAAAEVVNGISPEVWNRYVPQLLSATDLNTCRSRLTISLMAYQAKAYMADEKAELWLLVWLCIKLTANFDRQTSFSIRDNDFLIDRLFLERPQIHALLDSVPPEKETLNPRLIEEIVGQYCVHIEELRRSYDHRYYRLRCYESTPISDFTRVQLHTYLTSQVPNAVALQHLHRAVIRLNRLNGGPAVIQRWSQGQPASSVWTHQLLKVTETASLLNRVPRLSPLDDDISSVGAHFHRFQRVADAAVDASTAIRDATRTIGHPHPHHHPHHHRHHHRSDVDRPSRVTVIRKTDDTDGGFDEAIVGSDVADATGLVSNTLNMFLSAVKLLNPFNARLARRQSRKRVDGHAKSALSPVRDDSTRVSKSSTIIAVPRLRGGGPRPMPGSAAQNGSGNQTFVPIPVQQQAITDFRAHIGFPAGPGTFDGEIVRRFLQPSNWDVTAARALWDHRRSDFQIRRAYFQARGSPFPQLLNPDHTPGLRPTAINTAEAEGDDGNDNASTSSISSTYNESPVRLTASSGTAIVDEGGNNASVDADVHDDDSPSYSPSSSAERSRQRAQAQRQQLMQQPQTPPAPQYRLNSTSVSALTVSTDSASIVGPGVGSGSGSDDPFCDQGNAQVTNPMQALLMAASLLIGNAHTHRDRPMMLTNGGSALMQPPLQAPSSNAQNSSGGAPVTAADGAAGVPSAVPAGGPNLGQAVAPTTVGGGFTAGGSGVVAQTRPRGHNTIPPVRSDVTTAPAPIQQPIAGQQSNNQGGANPPGGAGNQPPVQPATAAQPDPNTIGNQDSGGANSNTGGAGMIQRRCHPCPIFPGQYHHHCPQPGCGANHDDNNGIHQGVQSGQNQQNNQNAVVQGNNQNGGVASSGPLQPQAQAPAVALTQADYALLFADEMVEELVHRNVVPTRQTRPIMIRDLLNADAAGNFGRGNAIGYRIIMNQPNARNRPRGWVRPPLANPQGPAQPNQQQQADGDGDDDGDSGGDDNDEQHPPGDNNNNNNNGGQAPPGNDNNNHDGRPPPGNDNNSDGQPPTRNNNTNGGQPPSGNNNNNHNGQPPTGNNHSGQQPAEDTNSSGIDGANPRSLVNGTVNGLEVNGQLPLTNGHTQTDHHGQNGVDGDGGSQASSSNGTTNSPTTQSRLAALASSTTPARLDGNDGPPLMTDHDGTDHNGAGRVDQDVDPTDQVDVEVDTGSGPTLVNGNGNNIGLGRQCATQ